MSREKTKFGDFIKELRNARKATDDSFSLRGVAEKAGISPTYLSKIERGELPPSEKAIRSIAKALELSADELFAKVEKIDPEIQKTLSHHAAPVAMAAFLRTASNLSQERLDMYRRMIDAAENTSKNTEKGDPNAEKIR